MFHFYELWYAEFSRGPNQNWKSSSRVVRNVYRLCACRVQTHRLRVVRQRCVRSGTRQRMPWIESAAAWDHVVHDYTCLHPERTTWVDLISIRMQNITVSSSWTEQEPRFSFFLRKEGTRANLHLMEGQWPKKKKTGFEWGFCRLYCTSGLVGRWMENS